MNRLRLSIWLPVAVLAVLAVWLGWPMPSDSRWDIHPDAGLMAGKASYLAQIAELEPGRHPNVLLIVADDLARHDLSFMGDTPLATPNIDALAARSRVYPNAYATAAICAPSRAALLTGRIQNRFGFESQPMQRYVRNRGEYLGFRFLTDTDEMQPFLLDVYPDADQMSRQGLPASEITLAEVLKARGYRTGIFGKWHLGYSAANHPAAFGFDSQYGFMEAFSLYTEEGREDVVEHRHALFWEEHIWSMGRSGASAITRNGEPVQEDRYLTDAILEETLAFVDEAATANAPFFAYVPFSAPHTPFQALRSDYDAVSGIDDHNQRVYAAMIRSLDRAVGRLIEHLEARGILDDTLVVFTSDNGGAAYTGATDNGPLRGGKFTQFEGGLAVPLLLLSPRSEAGRDPRPVLLSDLFATVLAALDLPLPADRVYDSAALLAPEVPERMLLWRSDFNGAIQSGRWKLMLNTRSGSMELYDLEADPSEQNDLAGEHPDVAVRLRKAFEERTREAFASPSWPRVMNYRYDDELGSYWFAI